MADLGCRLQPEMLLYISASRCFHRQVGIFLRPGSLCHIRSSSFPAVSGAVVSLVFVSWQLQKPR